VSGAFEYVRRGLRGVGLALLAVAVLGTAGVVTGALDSAALAIGAQSGYRTLAEIAVIGCLLCAIGFWDD
jgi:hypothetical protein